MPGTLRAALFAAVFLCACRRSSRGRAGRFPAAAGLARAVRDVVLVTIDTLRYDAVGFDGNARGTTPNLDRFAAEGRVFTDAHAHNVITLPSHTNILTGLYPYQHGVRDNAGFRLSPKVETLAPMLKTRGYATGAFVGASRSTRASGSRAASTPTRRCTSRWTSPRTSRSSRRAPKSRREALELVREAAGKPAVPLGPPLRPARAVRSAGAVQDRFAEDPYLGEVAYADAALEPLLDAVHGGPTRAASRRHGGPRRGPRRPRRADARPLHLRGDAPRAADALVPGPRRAGTRRRAWPATWTSCRRSSTPSAPAAPAELHGRSLLAAPRGARPRAPTSSRSRRLQSRMGAAARRAPRRQEVHRPAAAGALRPRVRSGRVEEPRSGIAPDALRRPRKLVLETPGGPLDRGPIGAEEVEKLRSLGYLSGRGGQDELRPGGRSEESHRRRSGSSTRSWSCSNRRRWQSGRRWPAGSSPRTRP